MPKTPPKYRAPALDKGLGILEFLAHKTEPLNLTEVAAGVGYSKGEIFRMVQVLEERNYIAHENGGYVLTNRLFLLGMERPPVKTLAEAALPVMHLLTEQTLQACHLAIVSGEMMVVIARAEPPGDLAFVVRVGHRLPFALSTSGTVLFAFQGDEARAYWLKALDEAGVQYMRKRFMKQANEIRTQGFARLPSDDVDAVTDLSAPILKDGVAVGALTIPYVERRSVKVSRDAVLKHLCTAVADISRDLAGQG